MEKDISYTLEQSEIDILRAAHECMIADEGADDEVIENARVLLFEECEGE